MTVDRSPVDVDGLLETRLGELTRASGGRLAIARESGWWALNLRLDPATPACASVAAVLGVELPIRPNTTAAVATGQVLWLGPDEWLMLCSEPVGELEQRLWAAMGGTPVSIVDVSAARTVITVRGPFARQVLAHGCALDLHSAHFPPGACVQTRLALADVILMAPPDQDPDDFITDPRFRLLVRTSFFRYVAGWLLDAAVEYTEPPY